MHGEKAKKKLICLQPRIMKSFKENTELKVVLWLQLY